MKKAAVALLLRHVPVHEAVSLSGCTLEYVYAARANKYIEALPEHPLCSMDYAVNTTHVVVHPTEADCTITHMMSVLGAKSGQTDGEARFRYDNKDVVYQEGYVQR